MPNVIDEERKWNESKIRKIGLGLAYLIDIPMAIFDALTIPIRNHVLPKWLKKKFPSLSCRDWPYQDNIETIPACRIQGRYTNLGIIEKICKHHHNKRCYRYVPEKNLKRH